MDRLYPESKVEVRGWEARHYDLFMDLMSLGTYRPFIRKAITAVGLGAGERVIVFGGGTGRNAELMLQDLGPSGHITAWEIGEEMRAQFRIRMGERANVMLVNHRADVLVDPPTRPYDHAFMSFVLHGLPHEARLKVLENALRLLKPGGVFHVLDYTQGPVHTPWYRNIFLNRIECPLAADFAKRDWNEIFVQAGFERPSHQTFMFEQVDLLGARKPVTG